MEIVISRQCESLTGSLGRGFGYHIQKRKNGFFAKRNTKGSVPNDGHLRFIFACAELAQNGLHITGIRVSRDELVKAVEEAGWCLSRFMEDLHPTLNAKEVLTFKQTAGL
jgi:hypothetical protein